MSLCELTPTIYSDKAVQAELRDRLCWMHIEGPGWLLMISMCSRRTTVSQVLSMQRSVHLVSRKPGKEYEAVESGLIAFEGKKPINPSGGLIGCGHPVGASGARRC